MASAVAVLGWGQGAQDSLKITTWNPMRVRAALLKNKNKQLDVEGACPSAP